MCPVIRPFISLHTNHSTAEVHSRDSRGTEYYDPVQVLKDDAPVGKTCREFEVGYTACVVDVVRIVVGSAFPTPD